MCLPNLLTHTWYPFLVHWQFLVTIFCHHFISFSVTRDHDSSHQEQQTRVHCTQVQLSELEGKVIGLYFAANWYPKCEAFTPVLAAAYRQLKDRGASFEVVFVSCDEDQPSFERFHHGMPWPAVPFSDLRCKKGLSDAFQVEGIPRLVVLAPDGLVICPDAAELVHRYGDQAFPFTPARVAELEADEQSKFASQTLEKLFSISYVKGSNEQVTSVDCSTGQSPMHGVDHELVAASKH